MRERPNRHAWRACVPSGTVGSNPTPSAVLRPWRGHIHRCLDPRVSLRGQWVQIPLPPPLAPETDANWPGPTAAPASCAFPQVAPRGDLVARTPPATPERTLRGGIVTWSGSTPSQDSLLRP